MLTIGQKHIRLRRHYKSLMSLQQSNLTAPVCNTIEPKSLNAASGEKSTIPPITFATPASTYKEMNSPGSTLVQGSQSNLHAPPPSSAPSYTIANMTGLRSKSSRALSSNPQYQAIQRVLLLNAYPLAYIILWIPGIANRLIEATGHTSSVMQILQASTQLVGLANALTYGWNERVAKQLKEQFSKNR